MRKIEFYLLISTYLGKVTQMLINLNTDVVERARKELESQYKVS